MARKLQYRTPGWVPPWPHAENHKLTPGVTHGRQATYVHGCRCRGEFGGDHPEGCTGAWRDYRRNKEPQRRARIRELQARIAELEAAQQA